jgi:hypothetical protein
MTRLSSILIAAVLAFGVAGMMPAQPQTPPPGASDGQPAVKGKKGLTKAEKKKLRQERRAAKKAAGVKMTAEQRAALRAKRLDCRARGKKEKLRGKKFRAFVRMCVKG